AGRAVRHHRPAAEGAGAAVVPALGAQAAAEPPQEEPPAPAQAVAGIAHVPPTPAGQAGRGLGSSWEGTRSTPPTFAPPFGLDRPTSAAVYLCDERPHPGPDKRSYRMTRNGPYA